MQLLFCIINVALHRKQVVALQDKQLAIEQAMQLFPY